MNEFHTRKVANEGVQVPLYRPDGTLSDHWIKIRGIDSDYFRRSEAKAKRKAIELTLIDDEDERAEAVRDTELECIASLISAWSFPQVLTIAEAVKFLREAPQIADMINRFAARRAEFFVKKLKSSVNGLQPKLSSKKRPKAQK